MKSTLVKKTILGIDLSDTTLKDVSEYIIGIVSAKGRSSSVRNKKLFIVTPNPEMVVYSSKRKEAQKLLNEADIAVVDGVGLFLAAQFLGKPLKERITGVDLMLKLCEEAEDKALSIGLLGGRPHVAELTAECLREKHKNLKIAFTGSDWDVKLFPKQGVDLLFVAYGFPKQELWIAHNLPLLPVKMAMGVGGAFDYISGQVKRAPFFIRATGLEWAFRLLNQPWRYKRQLKLFSFISLVLKERVGLNRTKNSSVAKEPNLL